MRRERAALIVSRAADTPANAAVAVAVAAALLARRRGRELALLALGLGGAGALAGALKRLVGGERPVARPPGPARGAAFPSAHASGWAAHAAALAILAPPRLRVPVAATGAALVGVVAASRVVLRAHAVRDVVAGAALGAGWVWLVARRLGLPAPPQGRSSVESPNSCHR
ncbi:phosphatase PAP2 family protein [Miltoncostaea marina]|uniref:phosphatase PAP2 family protein n=1 Tax=Miltoncostaea marina TaxID=2843215 RepID=UPI001C3DDBC3|nr:phosphatase PAP2 family protein [Miltoncostaea marina]